jgi:hypothetical protein
MNDSSIKLISCLLKSVILFPLLSLHSFFSINLIDLESVLVSYLQKMARGLKGNVT